MTHAALLFATRDLFESYGLRTWVEPTERRDGIHVPHVHLAESADCLLVMPASANSLHRLAHATCSDLLSMTACATTAPIVVAPVMNTAMWNHPATQRNVSRLRADGCSVIEPGLIVPASALAAGADLRCGGPGTLWRGPLGVMQAADAVLAHHDRRLTPDLAVARRSGTPA